MTDMKIYVSIDYKNQTLYVGDLWSTIRKGRESATFSYSNEWLRHPAAFSLEPNLQLQAGPQHSTSPSALFGVFADTTPDRWGRMLVRRSERYAAQQEKRTPRSLFERDYLLHVNDFSRLGALRFALNHNGDFLENDPEHKIPPLVKLPELLSAANNIDSSDENLQLLLAPGSSLGGARPKASVRNAANELLIAKFPHNLDDYNIVLWEAVALELANMSGIHVARHKIKSINNKSVLLLNRFDRYGTTRIPFISSMSMLNAKDNEIHSYLEIADVIKQYGSEPKHDLQELWSRIVFSIAIANTDDHLRNHGFLYDWNKSGWRLSPAYDLNPVPIDLKPRILSTTIDEYDNTGDFDLAMNVAEYFDLNKNQANNIMLGILKQVSMWRKVAAKLGINATECNRMESAFKTSL